MNAYTFDPAHARALCALLGEHRVLCGDAISEDFAHDEMEEYGRHAPDMLVEALNTEEVSALLGYCNAHDIPVTTRGAGTGLVGGAVATHGGLLLSTAKMKGITEIDEGNLALTCAAGTLLMEVQQAAAQRGLLYAPDPGEKTATIGGNVATNAGGMRAVKYGVTRDFVLGLTAVLMDGTVLRLGGKTAKNSSGYALDDLLVGSEGTLAVITEVTLRLLPQPRHTLSLLAPFDSLSACAATVPAIVAHRIVPTAIEIVQRGVIELAETYLGRTFPDADAPIYLLLSIDGNNREALDALCDELCEICIACGAKDALISNSQERHEAIWELRGALLEAIKGGTLYMDECDVVVPRTALEEFIPFCHEQEREHGVRIMSFGHAGDGNLHVYTLASEGTHEDFTARSTRALDAMYEKARALGGQISGEHGVGHAKRAYLQKSQGEETIALMRRIKQAFDPKGLLNPDKVI